MAQRGRPRKNAVTEQEAPQLSEESIEIAATEALEAMEDTGRPSVANPRNGRRKRVPINGYRNILNVEGKDPLFHYAWIRDDLVPRFESADYIFVDHDVVVGDTKINAASQVGSKISIPGGNGRTLYLMRQLKEYYDEDMAAYHTEIDESEASMFANLSKEAGRYGSVTSNVTRSHKGVRV